MKKRAGNFSVCAENGGADIRRHTVILRNPDGLHRRGWRPRHPAPLRQSRIVTFQGRLFRQGGRSLLCSQHRGYVPLLTVQLHKGAGSVYSAHQTRPLVPKSVGRGDPTPPQIYIYNLCVGKMPADNIRPYRLPSRVRKITVCRGRHTLQYTP